MVKNNVYVSMIYNITMKCECFSHKSVFLKFAGSICHFCSAGRNLKLQTTFFPTRIRALRFGRDTVLLELL
jgi:hypothetical protein